MEDFCWYIKNGGTIETVFNKEWIICSIPAKVECEECPYKDKESSEGCLHQNKIKQILKQHPLILFCLPA